MRHKGIQDIDGFLNPSIVYVEDKWLFDNMKSAVETLIRHKDSNSKILIIVDSDTDGFTAASSLYQYLVDIGCDVEVILHSGKQHGLNDVFDQIYGSDYKLIMIPDAGTNDYVEATELYMDGKEIIVLDHHLEEDCSELKRLRYNKEHFASGNPSIIVNNQMSTKIKDKAMTGVGVVYKFLKALDETLGINKADTYLDLVAIGMIGDRADLFNLQTRYYVQQGINAISTGLSKNKLISTLIAARSYSMQNKVTIESIGFYIVPLINAMIRFGTMEDKRYMFEAMCNSDKRLTRKVRGKGEVEMSIQEYTLKACEAAHRKQKKITDENVVSLSKSIEEFGLDKYAVLVCNAGEEVDVNVTGLIANKLSSKYQRPCLLLRRNGNICSGSGRGYDKCEIVDFNKWCKDTGLMRKVQGHDNAFGASIEFSKTYELFDLISKMKPINEPMYHVYGCFDQNTLTSEIIKKIGSYHYVWGSGVDEPIFFIDGIVLNKYNINLVGTKQNKLEFAWRNIEFEMYSKCGSLVDLYRNIIETGESIKFSMIGKFKLEPYKKTAKVVIEDLMFERTETKTLFF